MDSSQRFHSPACGLKTTCHGSTKTPDLRLTFILEMLLCPHDVLNESAVFEKLDTAIHAVLVSFVRFPVRET